jgi:16S rRNA (guanine(1405)-N(7))-methyltransferase
MSKRLEPAYVAEKVMQGRKYAAILPDLVTAASILETPKTKKESEAVKRVKTILHQMVGAYLDTEMPFADWLVRLKQVEQAERGAVCWEILQHHASTRERLLEIDEFFAAVFAGIPAPSSVVDLACGLNPLARPFMPLPAQTLYTACDVHCPIVAFVEAALKLMSFPVHASPCNLGSDAAIPSADVVLLLKAIPCLERINKDIGRQLLSKIDAPLVVVTYPTTALGGSRRGMTRFYEDRFRRIVPLGRYEVETRHFERELMFRLFRRQPKCEGTV